MKQITEHVFKYFPFYALGVLLVIGYFTNWFGMGGKCTTCGGSGSGTSTSTSGRIIFDTARCCKPGNPCGWSSATFIAQCGGLMGQ